MKRSLYWILLLSLIGAACGYFFGLGRGFGPLVGESRADRLVARTVRAVEEGRNTGRVANSPERLALLREALDSGDADDFYAFLEVHPRLSDEELDLAIAAIHELDERGQERWFRWLLSHWGASDSDAALGFVVGTMDRRLLGQGLWAVFNASSTRDPRGAFERWKEVAGQVDDRGDAEIALWPIFDHWGNADLAEAISTLGGLKGDRERHTAIRGAVHGQLRAVKQAPGYEAKVLAALRGMEDDGNRQHALGFYSASKLSKASVTDAAEWIDAQGFEGADLENVERQVASTLVDQDPEGAADWLMSRANDASRSAHLDALVSAWAQKEPNAAGGWLGKLELSAQTDSALESYSAIVSHDDIESAFHWASRITEPELRATAMERHARHWAKKDPEAAAAAVAAAAAE